MAKMYEIAKKAKKAKMWNTLNNPKKENNGKRKLKKSLKGSKTTTKYKSEYE